MGKYLPQQRWQLLPRKKLISSEYNQIEKVRGVVKDRRWVSVLTRATISCSGQVLKKNTTGRENGQEAVRG
jgi:hypothetical protein